MSLDLQLQVLRNNPKLFAAGVILLSIVARTLYTRRKRTWEGRPPMVSHLIPWVGSALEVGRDPDAFFRRAQKKYGDVFAVKTFGRVATYVVAPSLISEVFRNSQKYDFTPIGMEIVIDIFRVPASLVNADVTHGILHPSVHRYLSPTGIIPLIEPYTTAVLDLLQKEGSGLEGVSTPLHDFVVPVVSRASAYAFFGRSFPAVELGGPLRAFDGSFQLLLAGIPHVLLKSGTNGLATMHTLLEMYFDGPHDDASEFVLESEQVIRTHGYDSRTIGAFFVSLIQAMMANAPDASYWLITLNLQREEGLQPLVDEIDEAVTSWKQRNPGQRIEDHLYEFVSAVELPLLASTIQETLRYASYGISARRVTEPLEFGGYRFDMGDEIMCLPRLVHTDEEIHENASEYDPRRYMERKKLCKDGKIVPNHSMPWGGGVSMCGGRHFAVKQLRTFVVLLLMRYTLEVDPSCTERPTFIYERIGLNVMPPRGDIRVILHPRK